MACALTAGRVGFAELTDDFVRRPDVQALMKRVVVTPEDEDPARAGYAVHDEVTVETSEGRRLCSGRLTKIRGGPDMPLTRDELWAKFEACVQVGTVRVPVRKLFDSLMSLDRLPHVRELPGLAAS